MRTTPLKPKSGLSGPPVIFYFVCVGAVGVFNLFESLLAGVVVFMGGFMPGRWMTPRIAPCANTDPMAICQDAYSILMPEARD
jgi:hypothetical protein